MRIFMLTAAAVVSKIFLLSTSNAQEVENRKDYGTISSLPYCTVKTEVDIFTEEEKNSIVCMSESSLDIKDTVVGFEGHISSNEEDSFLALFISDPGRIGSVDEAGSSAMIRIDQNPPERIGVILASGLARISGSIEIKEFLNNAKGASQRIAIRIGRDTNEFALHANIRYAIEDFLNRTENLPAFRILD